MDRHVPASVVALTERTGHAILAADVAASAGLSAAAAEEYLGRLARQGKLARRGPGVFTVARQGRRELRLTPLLKRISRVLHAELPMTPVVGWTTEWLAPYSHNVPARHWTVLEAASYVLSSVAEVLARVNVRAVVDPPPEQVADLLRLFERPVVLWPHGDVYGAPPNSGSTGSTSKAATAGVRLPQPERLMVDLYFATTRRGVPYPQNDLATASARFIAERDLNVASMLAYANRRGIARELAAYLLGLQRLPSDVAQAVAAVVERHEARRRRKSGRDYALGQVDRSAPTSGALASAVA
jgi:hypothetical protein